MDFREAQQGRIQRQLEISGVSAQRVLSPPPGLSGAGLSVVRAREVRASGGFCLPFVLAKDGAHGTAAHAWMSCLRLKEGGSVLPGQVLVAMGTNISTSMEGNTCFLGLMASLLPL